MLWVRNGKVQRHECGNDLTEALRVYMIVKDKRKGATLRCKNMGFPPPAKYLPRQVKAKKPLNPPKIIKKGRKRYRKNFEIVTVTKYPMKELNLKGIWWCPYCREMRRFVKQKVLRIDGVRVPDNAYVCPMCKVPHRDHNVRQWNPVANKLFYELAESPIRAAPRDRKKEYQRKKRRRRQKDDE